MKRYYLNKDFIPKEFVNKNKEYLAKNNRRSLLLLMLISIVLFPDSIKYIQHYKESKNKKEEISFDSNINNESFYKYMDIIKDDTVGTFNNGNAILYFDGIDKLNEVLSREDIVVLDVEDLGDKRFKVEITKA